MRKHLIRILSVILVTVMCFHNLTFITKAELYNYTGNSTSNSVIESNTVVVVSNMGKVGGVVGGAAGFANDIYSMRNGLSSTTQNGQLIQGLLYATDMTFAMLGIAVGLALILSGPAAVSAGLIATVAVGGAISGILTGLMTSEWGGNILDSFFKVPNDTNAYKPNIYFYNENDIDITVQFEKSDLVHTSIPQYQNGWNIQLINNTIYSDGNSYPYLYYEALTKPSLFNYESCFVINPENRVDTFQHILTSYNFNSQEISDFIEFWDYKLDKNKTYLMFAQHTEIIDKAMPIDINPVPESISRIWFAFTTVKMADILNPDYNFNPIIEPVVREGYSMVEWGGFIVE